MFRIIKAVISLGALAGFVWFGMSVPLGDATLFGHVQAIWESEESQRLVDGTKQKVDEVSKDVTGMLGQKALDEATGSESPDQAEGDSENNTVAEADTVEEEITDEDRQALGELIRSKRQ